MKQHTATFTHTFFGTLLVVLTLMCVSYAQAEEMMAQPTERAQNTEKRQELREARQGALTVELQNRLINLSNNVSNRLTAATERLVNITGRLDSRIEKMKALGISTTIAEAKLADAKNSLEAAQDTLNELTSIEDAIRSTTPRESFDLVRTQFLGASGLIKQTRELLKETVSLLKGTIQNSDITEEKSL